MSLEPSELILNADQSIYHLHLHPEDLATTVILVGDPERVPMVSERLDRVEVRKSKREFITHTGWLGNRRLSVISTGIGTDNIDIVLNELDALANIDFETRAPRAHPVRLDLIRVGTSGALQEDIPVDAMVLSRMAIGFDGLLHFYESDRVRNKEFEASFVAQTQWSSDKATPYVVSASPQLLGVFDGPQISMGFTATNGGFYAPQGRRLRLRPSDSGMMDRIQAFSHQGMRITNMEMETAGIFGLAGLMGHRAASMNCILANRAAHTFSSQPRKAVERLIDHCLECLTQSTS
ncbi:nucleoside phosphorylase [Robiginitalea sp. M366]|uniref:nucleoside phosphorylase n=1 Tax=Robiginitalea aestuariiviva TaxID=3036903 RepID=UPI00240E3317|nr:nucleoside phosphorylase [Robiginitalea aestuariiviva]MDG1572887.1 nucleoside phosphorylase [Robiginitalea aestuariiviva]